jgi:hypothetical protein
MLLTETVLKVRLGVPEAIKMVERLHTVLCDEDVDGAFSKLFE